MKKLPKINTAKLLKAALPYIFIGLMATKLGQAYRMVPEGDVLDAAYRRTKAADKPAFRTAHEADLLLHEAAKRAFDAQGVKKLPTVKVLQAEYTELLTKKKAAYEDYKRLRKENQELQAVKSNVDTLLRIEEEPQEKKQEQHR